jgi:hypothetical protein
VPAQPVRDPLARHAGWILAGILLLALALRLWGVNFGLPYLEHPDETYWVNHALTMLKTGDPNPHDFNYPSAYLYLDAALTLVAYGAGRLIGAFGSLADLQAPVVLIGGAGKTAMPSLFLMGRILSVALGVGTVALAFGLGRRISGLTLGGALAGLWTAISPLLVAHSRFMVPDGPLVAFTTLTVWASWRSYETGRARHYLLAGAALGIAAGMKYNVAVFAVAIIAAALLRSRWRGLLDWRLYAAGGTSLGVFLLTTPYAVLDFDMFREGALANAVHYTAGHAGNAGNSLLWYLELFWRTEGPVLLLAGAGTVWGLYRRSPGVILTAATAAAYLLFISAFAVHFERSALLPSAGAESPGLRAGAAAALVILTLAFSLAGALRDTVRLTRIDSRDTARDWIAANVPPGSRIAMESYSPWVDPQRYGVLGLFKLSEHPAEWYRAEGISHLVFSQTMFHRFYRDPTSFRDEIALRGALPGLQGDHGVYGRRVRGAGLPAGAALAAGRMTESGRESTGHCPRAGRTSRGRSRGCQPGA